VVCGQLADFTCSPEGGTRTLFAVSRLREDGLLLPWAVHLVRVRARVRVRVRARASVRVLGLGYKG
jgi:hypothetical protein